VRGPDGFYDQALALQRISQAKGYDGDNPWADYANAGVDADGNIAVGLDVHECRQAANIREEDSETPWLTSRHHRVH
jgi:hypothetical protein